MRFTRLFIVLLPLLLAAPGHASDDKSDALTVLPWTDASFTFAPDSKNLTLQYTQLFGGARGRGWQAYGKFSAPLDQSTRVASFLSANKLVGGFQAQLQFGYDARARLLASLDDRLRTLVKLQKLLGTLPKSVSNGGLARFTRQHSLGPTGVDTIRYLCRQLVATPVCGEVDVRRALPPLEAAMCTQWLGTSCPTEDSFLAAAAKFQQERCAPAAAGFEADKCFSAEYAAEEVTLLRQDAAAETTANELDKSVALLWSVYQQLADDTKVKALEAEANQPGMDKLAVIIAHADEFADAVEKLLKTNALLRRDLLLVSLVPKGSVDAAAVTGDRLPAVQSSVVLSGSFSYDRLSVYRDSVIAAPSDLEKWDLQVGIDYTAYFMEPGIAVLGRVGYEGSLAPRTKSLERCTSVGGNATITGRTCDQNALYYTGADPKLANSAYLRVAFDYQFQPNPKSTQIVPGVELRAGIEGLGAAKSLDLRGTLFATPISGSAAARVGVGVDCSFAIDDSLDGSISRGSWTVVPFAFVGATASGLMAH
jgi:hypothetical protein